MKDKKIVMTLVIAAMLTGLVAVFYGCAGKVTDSPEYNAVLQEVDSLKKQYSELSSEKKALEDKYSSLKSEYEQYKEEMAPYEELQAAEAEARRIEAEKIKAEEEAKRKAEEEAEKKRIEELEKKGYDTGITYEMLARTPKDNENKKVKFSGQIVQVYEQDTETDLRLAVGGDGNKIILAAYPKNLISVRLLEKDWVTIYGISTGLYTYTSTTGKQNTIPLVIIDKIDY